MFVRLIRLALVACFAASQDAGHSAVAGAPAASEAISRSVTVVNAVDAPSARGVVSRSLSLVNSVGAPAPVEGISRSATVINYIAPPAFESISRSISVCLRPSLDADIDGDGDGDLDDVDLFVEALLDKNADFVVLSRGDVNVDCSTDALDIQHFVLALIER